VSERKPLEPVRVVREHAVDAEAERLRLSRLQLAEARAKTEAAKARVTSMREEMSVQLAKERSAATTARDHQQLALYRAAAEARIAEAEAVAKQAVEAEAVAARAVEERTRALADARAALDIVEKHQERTRATLDREAQERIDEAAEEGFAARFRNRTTR
jgi:hypothetical protein